MPIVTIGESIGVGSVFGCIVALGWVGLPLIMSAGYVSYPAAGVTFRFWWADGEMVRW
jgi:hypothetical protein